MQHPHAIGGSMDDNTQASNNTGNDNGPSQPLPPSDQSARYRLIYDDICRYCSEMWANITSVRSRAVEHVVFTASLLGLYLASDAASNRYEIGWWGLAGILILASAALPHLLLVMSVVKIDEFRLRAIHAGRPMGEPERQIVDELERKAEVLKEKSTTIGNAYTRLRNLWSLGVITSITLGVIEWLI